MQTRLTALDLIGYAAGDERPRQFVHMPEQELDQELVSIKVCTLSPPPNPKCHTDACTVVPQHMLVTLPSEVLAMSWKL